MTRRSGYRSGRRDARAAGQRRRSRRDSARQRRAQDRLLPDAARHPQPLQARGHRLAAARRRGARPAGRPADLGHRGADRGQGAASASLSYAEQIADPLLREAIELNAFEEGRHKQVLSQAGRSLRRYGSRPSPSTCRRAHAEWAFMVTGFSECIDSFFAFGLFALAKRSRLFPARAGRHLRAGHAGGGAPHPVLRQLGGVASPQPAVVAAAVVLG